jgi:hypothetical protein
MESIPRPSAAAHGNKMMKGNQNKQETSNAKQHDGMPSSKISALSRYPRQLSYPDFVTKVIQSLL